MPIFAKINIFQKTIWFHRKLSQIFIVPLMLLWISGTILIIHPWIDILFSPELQRVKSNGAQRELFELAKLVQESQPGWTLLDIKQAHSGQPAAVAKMSIPENSDQKFLVYCNPYEASILGIREDKTPFMKYTTELHKKFLLGKPGDVVVGLLGVILLLSTFSGIFLLYRYRKALKLKWNQGWYQKRPFYIRLHLWASIISLPLLLIWALTGSYLAFKPIIESTFFTNGKPWSRIEKISISVNCNDFREVITVARKLVPARRIHSIKFPDISKKKGEVRFVSERILSKPDDIKVIFNTESGLITGIERLRFDTPFHYIHHAMKPLHTGVFLGKWGLYIYTFVAFISNLLWITGIIMFLLRTVKKKAMS